MKTRPDLTNPIAAFLLVKRWNNQACTKSATPMNQELWFFSGETRYSLSALNAANWFAIS
jgi:hypothetical protein